MKNRIIIIVLSIYILTACTQIKPQAGSGLPVVDSNNRIQQKQMTAEENKESVEQIINDKDEDNNQPANQDIQEGTTAEIDNTNIVTEVVKQEKEPVPEAEITYYLVVKVVDGDTIDVSIDGKTERIRIIGLNTPETVDPRKQVECFGQEASSKANDLLSGQKVRLEADSTQGERDKYDRLLRYVYLKNGTDFSLKMIEDGYGYEYTYDLPYKNQSQYNKAETEARENERGLWAPEVCVEEVKEAEPEPAAALVTPATGSAKLTITNIFYDGVEGNKEPDEYVEIKNTGDPANLKSYTLQDESGKTYTFKDFNLAANQSVKVYTGCGDDTSNSLYWCFTSSAIWNNTGDTATLKDPGGEVVDSYNYKK